MFWNEKKENFIVGLKVQSILKKKINSLFTIFVMGSSEKGGQGKPL